MTPWESVLDGLVFAEAPRWHDGTLFVTDIFGGAVWRADTASVVVETPRPSGTGWLPDGRMLVVSMQERAVLVRDGTELAPYADLSSVASGDCNDMLVHPSGHAYVGNFGYDYAGGEERRAATLALVSTDGSVSEAAGDVWFPNGMALADDGVTLLLAETPAQRITAFAIADDGSLHDRRVWADLGEARPDGIAIDAEGGLWVASPGTRELFRVLEGGRITDRLDPPQGSAQACALGGEDGRTLFVCSTPTHDLEEALALRAGRVDAVRVDVGA